MMRAGRRFLFGALGAAVIWSLTPMTASAQALPTAARAAYAPSPAPSATDLHGTARPNALQGKPVGLVRARLGTSTALVLEPGAVTAVHISGTVTNAGSTGLTGIDVYACVNVTDPYCYGTTSIAGGSYSVAVAPNASYYLEFYDPSLTYAAGWYSTGGYVADASLASSVAVTSADVSGKNVTMPAAVHIGGLVTNSNPSGVSGIRVYACIGSNVVCYAATTAGDGTYSVAVAPNESYWLFYYDPSGVLAAGWYANGAGGNYTSDPNSATAVPVAASDVPGKNITLPDLVYSTYFPLTPARLLDSRTGNGMPGGVVAVLHANAPLTFPITGRGGVPSGASGVTGNLTVTDQTSGWAVYLGPDANPSPTSSTINFSKGEVRANGVTVALSASGTLSATFISTNGQTTDLVFDVTGYFIPGISGATYHPLAPARLLDSRNGNGMPGGTPATLAANTPLTFQVTGRGNVPANAKAVTGNLTVTDQTQAWAVYLGPDANPAPTSSTINFVAGEVRANNVTVALSSSGTLSATYMSMAGQTTALVFDVTGYFTNDLTGAKYRALTPARILDSRNGNGMFDGVPATIAANTPLTFQVDGAGGVPTRATGVTGNLTVTDQTSGWAVFLGPDPTPSPGSSTINFTKGQVIANGVTVALGSGGTLSATYISTDGQTTALVFDVTGYFAP